MGFSVSRQPSYMYQSPSGYPRHHIRVKWWGSVDASYSNLAFGYDEQTLSSFPGDQSSGGLDIPFYSENEEKPVFIGHYWMVGTPDLQQGNVCCVDYSAGKGEKLVCYSFVNTGRGKGLDKANFYWAGNLK